MAQAGWGQLTPDHHHNTSTDSESTGEDVFAIVSPAEVPVRPSNRASATSQETIRATPPINIPTPSNTPPVEESATQESFMEQYMRNRQPSVSFSEEVQLDSGHKQAIDQPLRPPPKDWSRGRSLMQALVDSKQKLTRPHSESEREHYDPQTGRHLPRYSSSPRREHPRHGEARFPLLQATVDAMARESERELPQNMSLTSDSTVSPVEEVHTPRDEQAIISPQNRHSPFATSAAFSYEEPKPFRRTASQRWRSGEGRDSAQDFLSRAGSLAKGPTYSNSRLSRQDSSNVRPTRSPRSAASSYLRGFSMSSSNSGDDNNCAPPSVDAEGQTIGEDYVLGKQIGWGGFSTIKEVTQIHPTTHVQRKLAVKIVRRHIDNKSEAENDQAQAEFEHEVELWRFLNHRHILPLEAVYKLAEATFCFIPLNVGGTLFDLIRSNRRGLPTALAQSYAFQLASALRYLHLDARVVHRDVKLENCLLEYDPNDPDGPGLLRMCDFGMAEWLSRDESFGGNSSGPPSPTVNETDRPPQKPFGPADTSTSAFTGGSLEYAAPEILRIAKAQSNAGEQGIEQVTISPERAIVSPAVDLWAYGVCVFSLIVGSRPFQNSFQPRVLMAILAGAWDKDQLHDKGGDEISELVEGCLEMEEEVRWDVQRVLGSTWLEGMSDRWEETKEEAKGWKL